MNDLISKARKLLKPLKGVPARKIAERFKVTKRTISKARQGHRMALYRIAAAVIGIENK